LSDGGHQEKGEEGGETTMTDAALDVNKSSLFFPRKGNQLLAESWGGGRKEKKEGGKGRQISATSPGKKGGEGKRKGN